MTLAWLKSLHIAALAIWCAGLLCLPFLLLAHADAGGRRDFVRLRHLTRTAYTMVTSPAAVVAILAGTALILVAGVITGWMFLKLAVVALMVMVHLHCGHLMGALASHGTQPPHSRLIGMIAGTVLLILAILWLVLAKPVIDTSFLPDWMHEPLMVQSPSSTTMPI